MTTRDICYTKVDCSIPEQRVDIACMEQSLCKIVFSMHGRQT